MAWEPWTGCYKKSDGCTYCYYYGPYSKRFGQNTVVKTDEFYKPERFHVSLPDDWGDGYDNVRIGCTVENQETADFRLPLYVSYPIKNRFIVCSPLLSNINLTPYLHGVESVRVSGENGRNARVCDYDWIIDIREQCQKNDVQFYFGGTGTHFKKDGVLHNVNPYNQKKFARGIGLETISGEHY